MKQVEAKRILGRVENLCSIIDVNARQKETSKGSLRNARKGTKQVERRLRNLRNSPFAQLLPDDFSAHTYCNALTFEYQEGTPQHKTSHNFAGHTIEELRDMAVTHRQKLETYENQLREYAHAIEQSKGHLKVAKERLATARKSLRKIKGKAKKAHRVVAKATRVSIKKALAA